MRFACGLDQIYNASESSLTRRVVPRPEGDGVPLRLQYIIRLLSKKPSRSTVQKLDSISDNYCSGLERSRAISNDGGILETKSSYPIDALTIYNGVANAGLTMVNMET